MAFAAFLLKLGVSLNERARHHQFLEYVLGVNRPVERNHADGNYDPAVQSTHGHHLSIQMHRDDMDNRCGNQEEEHRQVQHVPNGK